MYLHDDYIAGAVLRLDVNTVELVVRGLLIALALKYLHDMHLPAYQHVHQALKHPEVSLVAKHALHGPVEADYLLIVIHVSAFFYDRISESSKF